MHFLPAKDGDCFVLEMDNKDCIIIDCGYKVTYEKELKPLLLQLRDKGCRVILLLITHIDMDHIGGTIRLLIENGDAGDPRVIPINNIWFNGFFNTLFRHPEFVRRRVKCLNAAMLRHRDAMLKELRMQAGEENGLISTTQSISFEQLCIQNGYRLNRHFADAIVQRTSKNREAVLAAGILLGDCHLFIIGPTIKQLENLAYKLNIEMIRRCGSDYQLTHDEPFGILFELLQMLHHNEQPIEEQEIAASGKRLENWLCTSTMAPMNEINRASIVLEIEYKGIRMLFCGDADSADWADTIAPHYQLIKLSHHGSTKPNIPLIKKSRADILLISTNGGPNGRHPEDDLLARAILAGNNALYFNYNIDRKSQLLDFQEKYGFSARFNEREIGL